MDEVVVGVDESPSGLAALRWAARRARSTGAVLRAVHVLEAPEARELYAIPVVPACLLPDDRLDPAWGRASRAAFVATRPEPGWTFRVGQGHPGQVLVDASAGASLLVLGTREHRGFSRFANGSVSRFCIGHARCPVVAVPADPLADPAAGRRTRLRVASAAGAEPGTT